jgi:hypothetical protein
MDSEYYEHTARRSSAGSRRDSFPEAANAGASAQAGLNATASPMANLPGIGLA